MMFKAVFLLYLSTSVQCIIGSMTSYLGLAKDSSCTHNELNGRCVHIYRCLSTVEDLKSGNYPAICSFEGRQPIICCTDCELVEDTRNLVNTSLGIFYKTGQKARDHCLDYARDLYYPCMDHYKAGLDKSLSKTKACYEYFMHAVGAAGGRNARRDEYLHMALLGYGDDEESAKWLCGGSVISEKFILTAAHCISTPVFGSVSFATLGILKRSDPKEMWQIYRVMRIIPYPSYKAPSKYHDIALLETSRRISFGQYVLPACLQSEPDAGYYTTAFATGWGALGHRGELADTLQTVYLDEFNSTECADHYPPHRHLLYGYNHNTQMCYGHRQAVRDTCEGDSGGPLQNIYFMCMQTIIGVTSYGKACGFVGNSGMYTRVLPYLPWIEKIVWP